MGRGQEVLGEAIDGHHISDYIDPCHARANS